MADAAEKVNGRRTGSSSRDRVKQPKIVRVAERLGRRIPESELRKIPADLFLNLDNYLYGLPKR